MSEEMKSLTHLEARQLVGGGREYIHCFTNPNGMLIGADWPWFEFERALENASEIVHAGAAATAMGHTLAVRVDGRWLFFEKKKETT